MSTWYCEGSTESVPCSEKQTPYTPFPCPRCCGFTSIQSGEVRMKAEARRLVIINRYRYMNPGRV